MAAARGLVARGHQATIVCYSGTPIVEHIAGNGVETALVDAEASVAASGWELRKTLQDRFVEVAFVHTEREQLVVSSAMRLAERGAVVRRVPAFGEVAPDTDRFARKLATAGLLFSSAAEASGPLGSHWQIPAAVAPLGVDAASYDPVPPASRAALGVPAGGILIGCPYSHSGRPRLANVMRTLGLLGVRRPGCARGRRRVVIRSTNSCDYTPPRWDVTSMFSFLGEPANPRTLLKACDAVWVASESDDGAFALLDAMALKLPVIMERGHLAQHFVADGLTGIALPGDELELVASMVASFLASGDRRVAMGAAGRARVQRDFPESAMIDGFERAGIAAGDRTKWAVR